MSLLYYGSLSSFSGDTWKAEIRDASGVITTGTELVLAGNGIVFKYDGDGDEFYTNPLRSSSVSVFFNVDDSTDETFFENLSIQNEGDKAILIYKNNVLYWVGRILPDINQYDRKKLVNTQFEVVATDTLGILDQYTVDKTWFTDDKINGIDLVTQILTVTGIETFWNQVGVSEFFADGLFTYNIDSGSSDHLVDYQFNYLSFYKDVSALLTEIYPNFEGTITCKEALENILKVFNGRMILSDGMYFITSPQSYSAGTNIVYDIYDTTGTLVTNNASFVHGVNIGTTNRPKWEDFPVTTAQPALREIKTILKNKIAFKYDFRDVNNPSNAQLSVDDFDFSVGDDDIRVMANLVADGRQLRNQINYIFGSEVILKYRVFAWNGTTALFWDWENAAFRNSSPANNGWKDKFVAFTSTLGYKRQEFNIEFDQTYTSNVGTTGLATGYTLYAEFEVVHRVHNALSPSDIPIDFAGYVRIYQGKDTPIEVVTTNDTVSPIASKKEEVYMPYWDIDLKESIYTIKVWNGTNWVLPNNWVSFNSFSGRMENAFAKNVMSMYNKALVVTQGNWIDAGDYDVIKSLSFDSKTWLFNGGTFYPYSEQFDGEWLCIDDNTTGINVGSDDDLQEGDLNNQENLQLKIGKQVWNDLGENVTEYDKHLPYILVNDSVEAVDTNPSQNTEFAVKLNYNTTDTALQWNLAELGKAVTVTSDETVTDTSVQIFDVDTALGSINLTLPTPSTVKGREYVVKKSHAANTVTVTGTIDGSGSYLLDYENESVVLVSNGLEYVVKSEYGKDDLTDVTNRNNTTDNTVGVGALQLDLTPSATPTQGMLYWDEDEETAAIQVNGLNYEIGQGLYWVAKNQTGSTINKGTAVYASGTLGSSGRILISPMIADGTIEAKYFLGITAEDIANGDDGKVITQGKVRQIDTSGYTVGSVLWVSSSTAGALTSTQPTGSNLALAVAFVVQSASNGVMAVRVSVLDENAIGGTTPTLDEVTTAGNTTTNDIEVGGLNVDSGTLYVDSTNNRVGIGSTSPDKKLHIEDATRMDIKFEMTGSTNSDHYIRKDGRYLRFRGQDDSTVILELRNNSDGNQVVMPSGNVLIGSSTDDGSNKLQVTGDTRISGDIDIVNTNGSNPTDAGSLYFSESGSTWGTNLYGFRINQNGSNNTLNIQSANLTTVNDILTITRDTARVGIGTSSPDTNLHINGTGTTVSGNQYHLIVADDNTHGINKGGGIIFRGDFNSSGGQANFGAIRSGKANANDGNANAYLSLLYSASGTLTEGLRVNYNGNILIGTTTDNGYKLQVNGDATINGVRVGLGNNGVSQNTVVGYQGLNAISTGNYNTALGYQSGYATTTGQRNIAIGRRSLYANTTGSYNTSIGYEALFVNTGNYNTAVGYETAYSTTSGTENTAIGRVALRSNTTGSRNTAIGNATLYDNTASNNTAVGDNAARYNTTGSIVAVGYQAGFSNTTSVGVTAIGYQALKNGNTSLSTAVGHHAALSTTSGKVTALGYYAAGSLTTGSEVTAIGQEALRNYTGSESTALGHQAGYSMTTPSYNTVIGRAAAYSTTTGHSNTAIGRSALYNNVTGGKNTAIGINSLVNTTNIENVAIGSYAGDANTTGSNNIFIGHNSDGVSATDSNRTFIGNSSTTSTWVGGNLLVGTTVDNGSGLRVFSTGNGELEVERSGGAQINLQAQSARGVIGTDSNHELLLKTNSTARVWITTGGNVGIGTSSPTSKTHIYYGGGTTNGLHVQASANRGKIAVSDNDTAAYMIAENSLASFGRQDALSSNNLNITNGGNVLIGTTTDGGYKLNVNGTTKIQAATSAALTFEQSSNVYQAAINSSAHLVLQSAANNQIIFKDGGATNMVIDGSTARVGIGTTSPSANLHIAGGVTILGQNKIDGSSDNLKIMSDYANVSGNSTIEFSVDNSEKMRITNAGNVLIGTTTDAGATVHIRQSSSGQSPINSPSLFIENNGSSNSYYALQVATQGGGYSFNVTNAGNVGIGTTSPQAKMQISSGNNTATQMLIGEGSTYGAPSIRFAIASTNYMGIGFTTGSVIGNEVLDAISIQRTGNVGISNTSPNYTLDVTGDINATSDYYHNGTQGYTGTVTIQQTAPNPPINIDINGGIITNVY